MTMTRQQIKETVDRARAEYQEYRRTHLPSGEPFCVFTAGSLYCIHDPCPNPNHRPIRTHHLTRRSAE